MASDQEVKPQGAAKEEAREDDYNPTHEHTRVVGCANVTDIGCRIARMPSALDMFVINCHGMTNRHGDRYQNGLGSIDSKSMNGAGEPSEGRA